MVSEIRHKISYNNVNQFMSAEIEGYTETTVVGNNNPTSANCKDLLLFPPLNG